MRDIVIIQLARMGDIIQTIPLISDLKTIYPKANISLLINEVFNECRLFFSDISIISFYLDDLNDNILKKKIGGFKDKDILVINLNNSEIAKNIVSFINSNTNFGFGSQNSLEWTAFITSFLKTRLLSSINLVDVFRNMVCPPPVSPVKVQGKSGNTKAVSIQCRARNVKRRLTFEHYSDITSYYLDLGYEINLLGIESEKPNAQKVMDKFNHPRLKDYTGKTNLSGLIDIISYSHTLYTPDTGTMHITAMLGGHYTSIFLGPAYPFETLGYSNNANIFMPDSDYLPCYPCHDDAVCHNNYKCHSFSFKKHFKASDDKRATNEAFITLSINYDELGQFLLPINEMALIWRCFAKLYFMPNHYNIQKAKLALSNLSENVKKSINRELKLWDYVNQNQLIIKEENFYFLKPLLFYNILNDNKNLTNYSISFFREI